MASVDREIKESPLRQGMDEQVAYNLTTTPWGSAPTNELVKLYQVDGADLVDVSDSKLSGVATVLGDVITTPLIGGLAPGKSYRLEIKFTVGGNVFEAWAMIVAER